MATTDMNLNHADCLRSVSDFGSTTVHNICSGATHTVPWGSADWAFALVVGMLFGGFGLTMLAMGFSIVFRRY